MADPTLRFYDPESGKVTTIPVWELSDSMIAANIRGIEGTVFIDKRHRTLGEVRQADLAPELVERIRNTATRHRELFLATIEKLATAVALRDDCTGDHSQRVTVFAILLGQQLHLSAEDLELIRVGTPLHDIGKIGIEDAILRKPGKLTPAEFEVMKTHTTLGTKFIEPIPDLRPALPIVRSHHERWDGHGYPDGLKGEDIPRLARIVAVADAFDAMVFDTPYRQGRPVEIAFAEIERQQGAQFAPEVVAALFQIRAKVAEEMHRFEKK
jgi:HD-GYP domain-containing protein (c-di-GMP phosphodiesterase class II)